jgi:hypothetical protein
VSLSFPTISAAGPNASIIHYNPRREAPGALHADQLYLCDSGAQFMCVEGGTGCKRTRPHDGGVWQRRYDGRDAHVVLWQVRRL